MSDTDLRYTVYTVLPFTGIYYTGSSRSTVCTVYTRMAVSNPTTQEEYCTAAALGVRTSRMPPRRLAGCILGLFASLANAQQDPAGCHTYAGCWAQPSGAAAWFDAQTTFQSCAHRALTPLRPPPSSRQRAFSLLG